MRVPQAMPFVVYYLFMDSLSGDAFAKSKE